MKEKEKLLDKESINLNLEKMTKKDIIKSQIFKNELSRKISLQERGITLIALVVTIIILLILAGVTLNIALSDGGLFSKTKDAAEKYKQAQSDEEEMVRQIATQMYSEYVGIEVKNYDLSEAPDSCKIETATSGSDEEQNINRESLTWRVWDFDGNKLRIVGDQTINTLELKGAKGYNNGVWALDHICSTLYSNGKEGVTATTLKRSDIQKVSTYDYTKYKHSNVEYNTTESTEDAKNTIQFGEKRHYDAGKDNYPEMWEKYDKDWTYEYNDDGTITGNDKECTIWETIGTDEGKNGNIINGNSSSEGIDFKESTYNHYYDKSEFINDKYFNLIFGEYISGVNVYWLGTRSTFAGEGGCSFGLCTVRNSGKQSVGGYGIFGSQWRSESDVTTKYGFSVRPIVTINLSYNSCSFEWKTDESGKPYIDLKWN